MKEERRSAGTIEDFSERSPSPAEDRKSAGPPEPFPVMWRLTKYLFERSVYRTDVQPASHSRSDAYVSGLDAGRHFRDVEVEQAAAAAMRLGRNSRDLREATDIVILGNLFA